MSDTSEQRDVIAFLSDPANYEPRVPSVERYETHGSIVFLAGDRAYKLKRAVRFPYMDYSTVARRHEMCLRELETNRRTAPMLYIAVRPIVRDSGGALRFGSETKSASAADWIVVMRRFEQSALLESMRHMRQLSRTLMRFLAELVAEFHRNAEIVRTLGGAAGIQSVIEENATILSAKIGRPFDAEIVSRYAQESFRAFFRVSQLLEQRRQTGDVRRCHGDLHLNNVCMIDGRPVLFDAIEFNDRFACIDILYDLAFLLMDLDGHGLRHHANTVLNRYLEVSAQHVGLKALPLFLSCRAAIRAHTAVAAAEAATDRCMSEVRLLDGKALLDRAIDYFAGPPPRLVAIGGLSGTGKSTLARDLAPLIGAAPGAIVIRSDIIRKQLMGVPDTERLPESAYAPAVTERVYRRMLELAATTLNAGYAVIADAVFGKGIERRDIAETAVQAGVRFDGLWLEAPLEVLESRVTGRQGDASDATVQVLHTQLQFVETPKEWMRIPAAAALSETATAARLVLGC